MAGKAVNVEILKRYGIEYTFSKYGKSNPEPTDDRLFQYEKEVKKFLTSLDFSRLEQTVTNQQWRSVITSVNRLEVTATDLGLVFLERYFKALRTAATTKNVKNANQSVAMIDNKRTSVISLLKMIF